MTSWHRARGYMNRSWTAKEYLVWERQQSSKHEFRNGKVFSMNRLWRGKLVAIGNIIRLLGNAIEDRQCEVYPSGMRVRIPNRGYRYPDASALCGEPVFEDENEDVLVNPGVIFEVIADATEAACQAERWDDFRAIKSLRDYVLVSHLENVVAHSSRDADGTWTCTVHRRGGEFELCSLRCKLVVDGIYRRVTAPSSGTKRT